MLGDLTSAMKARIDRMTYEQMLHAWRFAPAGDPMFVGATGKYFSDEMAKKSIDANKSAVSKKVGW